MNNTEYPIAYGCKNKNIDVRLNSRSGGVFTAVSDVILENGGTVYGCVLDSGLTARHIRAESKEERDLMRGSKYVQSDMGDCFLNVKEDLNCKREVLFSGTPCQVDGLLSFLKATKTDCTKLLTLDLVCHGVPSPKLWRDYIEYQEKKIGGIIKTADFRNKKDFGWRAHKESFTVDSRKYDSDIYASVFYTNYPLRRSCHECNYASKNRVSDITLADFWGIDNLDSSFNDNKGVSLILINSEKGNGYFNKAKNLEIKSFDINEVNQRSLEAPYYYSFRKELFWKDYREHGFEYLVKKYVIGNPLMPLIKKAAARLK